MVTPPGTRANPKTRPVKSPRAPRHVETFCSARHVLHFSLYVIVREMARSAAAWITRILIIGRGSSRGTGMQFGFPRLGAGAAEGREDPACQ